MKHQQGGLFWVNLEHGGGGGDGGVTSSAIIQCPSIHLLPLIRGWVAGAAV